MKLEEQAAALLDEIRSALSITWQDDDTDLQLKGIIARGMSHLNDIAGEEQDYALPGKAQELLINYCLYARSGALDQFMVNYLSDMNYLQLREEVKRYIASQESNTSIP